MMLFFDLLPTQSLVEIEQRSQDKIQVLFKHSTRCIVSSMAFKTLKTCTAEADCWVLDLLQFRELSNELSQRYDLVHQSPQIIVLHRGKMLLTASHENITCELIQKINA